MKSVTFYHYDNRCDYSDDSRKHIGKVYEYCTLRFFKEATSLPEEVYGDFIAIAKEAAFRSTVMYIVTNGKCVRDGDDVIIYGEKIEQAWNNALKRKAKIAIALE
jgi:hypothetical protein